MHQRYTYRTIIGLLIAAGVAMLGRRLRRYEVAENSMQPVLQDGDYVVAVKPRRPLLRGDVVITPHPVSPSFDLVKRVIGLPGETITIDNGQVHVNGAVLPEPWAVGPTGDSGDWALAAELFILGDQRPISSGDSRTIGPITTESEPWKVLFRYWPLQRIGPL